LFQGKKTDDTKEWYQEDWWLEIPTLLYLDMSYNRLRIVPEGFQRMKTNAVDILIDHNPLKDEVCIINILNLTQSVGTRKEIGE